MTNKTRKRIRGAFKLLAAVGLLYAIGTPMALEWGDISNGRAIVQALGGMLTFFLGLCMGDMFA